MTREEELELENKQLKMAVEEMEMYARYLMERVEMLENQLLVEGCKK